MKKALKIKLAQVLPTSIFTPDKAIYTFTWQHPEIGHCEIVIKLDGKFHKNSPFGALRKAYTQAKGSIFTSMMAISSL